MDEKDYFDHIDMDIKWPYPEKSAYIVTQQKSNPLFGDGLRLISQSELISKFDELKTSGNIWLVGENVKYHAFKHNMVDMMCVVVVPLRVASDKPFYVRSLPANRWNLTSHEVYDNGVLRIIYEKHQP